MAMLLFQRAGIARRRGGYGYRLGTRPRRSRVILAWIAIALAGGGLASLALADNRHAASLARVDQVSVKPGT